MEEGNHPVVEHVEKIEKSAVLGTQALKNELAVAIRKDALRAAETHEVHGHSRGTGSRPLELLNLAGRKGQGAAHGKAHRFVVGIRKSTDGHPIPPQALEQGDGLEEFKGAWIIA
jgi:hypothetical protein